VIARPGRSQRMIHTSLLTTSVSLPLTRGGQCTYLHMHHVGQRVVAGDAVGPRDDHGQVRLARAKEKLLTPAVVGAAVERRLALLLRRDHVVQKQRAMVALHRVCTPLPPCTRVSRLCVVSPSESRGKVVTGARGSCLLRETQHRTWGSCLLRETQHRTWGSCLLRETQHRTYTLR